jgi:hypothetical protein
MRSYSSSFIKNLIIAAFDMHKHFVPAFIRLPISMALHTAGASDAAAMASTPRLVGQDGVAKLLAAGLFELAEQHDVAVEIRRPLLAVALLALLRGGSAATNSITFCCLHVRGARDVAIT